MFTRDWKILRDGEPGGGGSNPPGNTPPPNPPPPDDDPGQWDKDRARATIDAQRASERELKKQLATAKAEVEALAAEKKKREEAELSEIDRLKKQNEETATLLATKDAEIKETKLRYQVSIAATKLNIVDPDVAFLLLNKTELKDEDSVESALKELIKAKPYLASKKDDGGGKGDGPPPTPKPDPKGQTAEQLREAQAVTARGYRSSF